MNESMIYHSWYVPHYYLHLPLSDLKFKQESYIIQNQTSQTYQCSKPPKQAEFEKGMVTEKDWEQGETKHLESYINCPLEYWKA